MKQEYGKKTFILGNPPAFKDIDFQLFENHQHLLTNANQKQIQAAPLDKRALNSMIDSSRSSTGGAMVQSVFPGNKKMSCFKASVEPRRLGIELALPLTLLAFIFIAEQSPLLKMYMDRVLDWLCEHDYVAYGFTTVIFLIPIWMIAIMILERQSAARK